MPAIEPQDVRDLAVRLRQAGLAGDWDEVARLDAVLSGCLEDLRAAVETRPEMDEALREVARAHAQVQDLSQAAMDELAARMVALQTEHAAGRAYAQQEGVE